MNRILCRSLFGIILMILLASCPAPMTGGQAGSLTVAFNAASLPNRSILPDIDMNPAGYVITGSGPGGASFMVETTDLSVTVNRLAFGTWTVAVEAENASGVVIGRGEGSAAVHTGQSASLTVIVRPLDGYGTLDLTVNWNAADTDSPSIDATLTPYLGGTQALDFTISGGNQGRYHNDNVQTGYHTLIVKLLDNGLLTMGAVEVVRIVRGGTSTGVFDFTEINKPGGNIVVNITPDMAEPLEVSMSGQAAELPQGQTMTVSASVANDPGNVVYVWYVNGDAIGTGQTITFGSTLPIGVYRLDVTAFTADGRRGGSASALFHVVEETIEPVIVQQISTGGNTSFALRSDGTLWAAGLNYYGELGTGDLKNKNEFTLVLTDVKLVRGGGYYNFAIKQDGTLWGTGRNDLGQLGTGDNVQRNTFVQVLTDVKNIYCGYHDSFAVKNDDTVWATGGNTAGKLGLGDGATRYAFTHVTGNVEKVACGETHAALLKKDGTIWTAGTEAGSGKNYQSNVFVQVENNAVDVAAGYIFTLIVKNDSTVWGTGSNNEGQLGITASFSSRFVQISADTRSIACGGGHSVLLKNDGSVWTSGLNTFGQLGNGDTTNSNAFRLVFSNASAVCSTGGAAHTLVLDNNGVVWAVGRNTFGQLGTGDNSDRSLFEEVFR